MARVRPLRRAGLAIVLVALGACQSRSNPGPPSPPQTLAPSQAPLQLDSVAVRIRSLLATGRLARPERPDLTDARAQLDSIYSPGGQTPIWIDSTGAPTHSALAAIQTLRAAPDDGLDSTDYSASWLEGEADSLASGTRRSAERIATFDVGLTTDFLRFLTDMHVGRVNPRALGFKLDLPADRHTIPMTLLTGARTGRIAETVDELRPLVVLYGRIKQALATYRHLAPDTDADLVPAMQKSLRPGDQYAGAARLYRRLIKLGDLEAGSGPPADSVTYSTALAEGVRRFQDRHGLEPDGVLGKGTIAALNVPVAERIEQLRLSLERLRWLPDLPSGPFVVVNIPVFRLWAWDSLVGSAKPALEMSVIVGKSLDTQTPVFSEEMRYLIFRPYWNVPASILRKEMLPRLSRDYHYLDRNDLEIVRGQSDNAVPVAPSPAAIKALRAGQLRLRQRPGPNNSLGLVKFMFPNEDNIYLHGTPAQELFSRTRRDFSHGCVRVENPVDLAVWALNGVRDWDRARIEAVMKDGPTTRVNLARPIPVLLFYTTASVTREGKVQFFRDIYGHDARLLTALQDGRP